MTKEQELQRKIDEFRICQSLSPGHRTSRGRIESAYVLFKRYKPEEARKIQLGEGPAMNLYLCIKNPRTRENNGAEWQVRNEVLRNEILQYFPKLPELKTEAITLTQFRDDWRTQRWLEHNFRSGFQFQARLALEHGNALVLRLDSQVPVFHEMLQCTIYNIMENCVYTAQCFENVFDARALIHHFLAQAAKVMPPSEDLQQLIDWVG